MKGLIVIFVILQSTCYLFTYASDFNPGFIAKNPNNISKLPYGTSSEFVNRTENVPLSSPHPDHDILNKFSVSPNTTEYFHTTEEPLETHEDHQDVFIPVVTQNLTKTGFGEVNPTEALPQNTKKDEIFAKPSVPSNNEEYAAENITMEVKPGKLVNLTCGPNDVTRLVETNFGKNFSIANMSWQWKVLWLNHSSDKGADGIQIIESGDTIILLISSFSTEQSGTYTCAAQDPSNKVWILKTLELTADDPSKVGMIERSSDKEDSQSIPSPASYFTQLDSTEEDSTREHSGNSFPASQQDIAVHLTSTAVIPDKLSYLNSVYFNKSTSSENMFPSTASETVDFLPSTGPLYTNSNKEEEDDHVQTPKTFLVTNDLTTETNASERQMAEEPAKMEEQKALQVEEENNASGVAIGVALAIVLTAVATTLVLYRHRRNGKKSTYITFGNPSYSRENLPANDYGLDSPLTLSSNGYTVLA